MSHRVSSYQRSLMKKHLGFYHVRKNKQRFFFLSLCSIIFSCIQHSVYKWVYVDDFHRDEYH